MRTAGIALVAALAFVASGADASCKGDARSLVRVSQKKGKEKKKEEGATKKGRAREDAEEDEDTRKKTPASLSHLPHLPLFSVHNTQSGVCKAFINYFREHIDELGENPSMDAIKAALGKAPIPGADCCKAIRPFIEAGCPCDKDVLSLASRANIKASTLRTLSKAVPVSACAAPEYGANVKDHCSASAFAQISAQVAEEAAEEAAEAAYFAATLKAVAEAEKATADAEAAEPAQQEAEDASVESAVESAEEKRV
jgi:hypothetical protein